MASCMRGHIIRCFPQVRHRRAGGGGGRGVAADRGDGGGAGGVGRVPGRLAIGGKFNQALLIVFGTENR